MGHRDAVACRSRCWGTGVGLAGAAVVAAAMIGVGSAPVAGADSPAATDTVGALATPAADDDNDALVLVPLANQDYAQTADQLYLAPNGFDGTATVFITPEPGNEIASVAPGVQALVQAVEADYTAGDLSTSDPLYIFGYSQGAVESGLAEQQLHDFGIPSADLHFVMVGDSSSAEGGFLNSFVDSFPSSQQQSIADLLGQFGLTPPVLGATTPDDLYPTDVYSLSGDGWANWDDGANISGMFTEHLAYLGLTPAEIASATETTDGMTDYYTINSSNVDFATALYNQLLLSLDVGPTSDSARTVAEATASTVTANADFHILGADLGAEIASALDIPDVLP